MESSASEPTPVLTVPELASLLVGGRAYVLVDCRFNLGNLAWGRQEYASSHLPGAVFADLEQDLSGEIVRGKTGRHPLPEPEAFAVTAGRLGIDASTHVVAYDDGSCMFAPRLWWLLKWLGHGQTSVLRGGIKAWVTEGQPLETTTPTPSVKTFRATPNPSMVATLNEVEASVANNGGCLLDARAEARFRGEQEPIDPVAGHIPTARNLPFTNLLEAGGPKPSASVRTLLETAITPASASDVIAYCGSGVTACALIWAAACAGVKGIRLYPGSWSEWITSEAHPVAKG
jgi:thiosulfate/3-mercaptopyruvate sulfurtransferase